MTASDHLVLIVDDDSRVREGVQELMSAAGLCSVTFGSAAEYIAYPKPAVPACLILDVELPDVSGLDLQQQIREGPPIIFVTGHGDIASTVRAIKAGALDFMTKPFDDGELLELVQAALALDRERRAARAKLDCLRRRVESLTAREREVFPLVASGLLNKQAAVYLGISEVTFQIHRTHVMRKMRADSLPDLVRMAASLHIPVAHTRHG